MDTDTPPPLESTPAPASSLAGRLVNVIVAPGEVFEELKQRPVATANWLVPMIILILVSWASAALVYSQDFARQQMSEMQATAMKPRFQAEVAKGKMTQQQADQALESAQKVAGLIGTIAVFAGAPFGAAIGVFLGGLMIWLLGAKVLKGQMGYLRGVEIAGLLCLISALGELVKGLVIVLKGNIFASPSLALLLSDLTPTNLAYGALSAVNPFTFWYLIVLGLALAVVSGASKCRAATWVWGLWVVLTSLMTGFGLLMIRLTPH